MKNFVSKGNHQSLFAAKEIVLEKNYCLDFSPLISATQSQSTRLSLFGSLAHVHRKSFNKPITQNTPICFQISSQWSFEDGKSPKDRCFLNNNMSCITEAASLGNKPFGNSPLGGCAHPSCSPMQAYVSTLPNQTYQPKPKPKPKHHHSSF